jgi:hypothetical protein
MLSLLTSHGRATPVVWLTVASATLKNHRNEYEYQVLVRLAEALARHPAERSSQMQARRVGLVRACNAVAR